MRQPNGFCFTHFPVMACLVDRTLKLFVPTLFRLQRVLLLSVIILLPNTTLQAGRFETRTSGFKRTSKALFIGDSARNFLYAPGFFGLTARLSMCSSCPTIIRCTSGLRKKSWGSIHFNCAPLGIALFIQVPAWRLQPLKHQRKCRCASKVRQAVLAI